ncbi:MAG TPA: ATP-binding protein [Candidatus Saccharimonadales bacterium]|nr:ATP-binding protein [Candidatus Saccharimonadales bacterium]
MYKGGSSYTPRSAHIIRFAGLFVPIILVLYGVFAQFNLVQTPHTIDTVGFFLLSFWWLYISVLQFLVPSKTAFDSGLRLVTYHLLAGAYLIFVSGVASPFIACWLLLMMASYTYFSKRGLQLSVLALVLVVAVDITLWYKISLDVVIYDLVALTAILITGVITLGISQSQEVARSALNRSKAQESLQRDRILTIVNNLADAVLSTDKDGIIKVYNAASLNLLDTNDSLNGQHIDEVLPLHDLDGKKVSLVKIFKKAKSVVKRDDLNYTFEDDESIRLEVTYSPIRSSYSKSKKAETHDGYIVIMRDVTKSKSLEEERDEFISVVSHELRTPITIAEGTISNVQVMMEHPDITTKMLKDAVNTAHEQILFLAHMVNDLSTLSRAERGVADTAEDININEMAHKLLDKYTDEAKEKKLHLDLDLAPKVGNVHTSRLYLEELLQNFITNAIKYTKEGGVTIIIKQKSDEVTFAVKDTGIGISKTDQPKVFGKFYRSEDYRTRETGGTGLGLYVASKLARKLGTQIKLTSRLNFGSTFSFSLPVSTSDIKKK